jgi:hypothetical protein
LHLAHGSLKLQTNNCIDFIRKKKLLTTPLEGSVSDSDESEYRGVVVSDTNADPEESIIKEQKAAKNARNSRSASR